MSVYGTAPTKRQIIPAGADTQPEELNWEATQVIADNPTAQWLKIVPANRYVPPGVFGAVIPFGGVTEVQAVWEAPPGVTQPGALPKQEAVIVWLSPEISAQPSPGVATTPTVQLGPDSTVTIEPGQNPIDVTGSVDVTGDVTIDTSGGPVAVDATGTVDIGNTPAVTIDTSGGPVTVGGTVDVSSVTSITDPVSVGGTVDVQGVAGGTAIGVAGTVDIGNTPAVTIDTSSGPVDVNASGTVDIGNTPSVTVDTSGGAVDVSGTVDIGSGNAITIEAGQGGVNVDTQTPATSPGTISIPAGQKGGSLAFTPGPGCTAIGVVISGTPAADLEVTGITAVAANSGTDYFAGDLGSLSLTKAAQYISTPIPAGLDGAITVAVDTLNAPTVATTIAMVVEYFGQAAAQPTAPPEQPLLTQGPLAQGQVRPADQIAIGPNAEDWNGGPGGYPAASIDQVVAGNLALTQNSDAAPSFDVIVGGNQGASGKSVQTVPEVCYTSEGLPTGGIVSLPANSFTQVGSNSPMFRLGNVRRAWLRLYSPSGLITSAWQVGSGNIALTDAQGTYFKPGLNAQPVRLSNPAGGHNAVAGPFIIPPGPLTSIAWTISPGATAFDSDLYCVGYYEYETGAQYPPQVYLKIGYAATAGGIEEVVAGVGGQSIRLRRLSLSQNTTGPSEVDLQSPSGTAVAGRLVGQSMAWDQEFSDAALPVGEGLYIYTQGAGAVVGTLEYDLY